MKIVLAIQCHPRDYTDLKQCLNYHNRYINNIYVGIDNIDIDIDIDNIDIDNIDIDNIDIYNVYNSNILHKNLIYFSNPLNNDFAQARNNIVKKIQTDHAYDWILFVDADEIFYDLESLIGFLPKIPSYVKVVGFPRYNIFGDKLLDTYPDIQCRLIRPSIKWINNSPYLGASPGLHETPNMSDMKFGQEFQIIEDVSIIHIKSQEKQDKCKEQWKNIRSLHQK